MSVINLPNDVFPGQYKAGEVFFHNYIAHPQTFRGKSVLHTNAISIVISGEKTMHFANKTVHIKDDAFHFLSAGNCVASMELSERSVFHSILVFFDNKVLSDFFLKYHKRVDQLRTRIKLSNEAFLDFKKDPFTINYIQSLLLIFTAGKSISPEMGRLKFEELLLHLLETHPEQLLSFRGSQSTGFDDIELRKVVETHVNTAVNLDELAFMCNISLSTFKRRFMKIYGTSPGEWFLQQRMETAKELLSHYNERPGEIYYKVGYENHSSFSETFKQTFGLTPSAFQARELAQTP